MPVDQDRRRGDAARPIRHDDGDRAAELHLVDDSAEPVDGVVGLALIDDARCGEARLGIPIIGRERLHRLRRQLNAALGPRPVAAERAARHGDDVRAARVVVIMDRVAFGMDDVVEAALHVDVEAGAPRVRRVAMAGASLTPTTCPARRRRWCGRSSAPRSDEADRSCRSDSSSSPPRRRWPDRARP